MAETTTTPSILNSSSYHIPPLSGSKNYLTWCIQITDILYELGLYDYVSGTKEKPKRGDTTEWNSADCRALTTIRLCISNTMMTREVNSVQWWMGSEQNRYEACSGRLQGLKKFTRINTYCIISVH